MIDRLATGLCVAGVAGIVWMAVHRPVTAREPAFIPPCGTVPLPSIGEGPEIPETIDTIDAGALVAEPMAGPFDSLAAACSTCVPLPGHASGGPFTEVTVLSRGDLEAAPSLGHTLTLELLAYVGGAWWTRELGSVGPVCMEGSPDGGAAWLDASAHDLEIVDLGMPVLVVQVDQHVARTSGSVQWREQVVCGTGRSGVPSCARIALAGTRVELACDASATVSAGPSRERYHLVFP